jgi:hypothetical protein
MLKFFDEDPGWKKIPIWDGKKVRSGIPDKHPGSAALIVRMTTKFEGIPSVSKSS